MLTRAADTAVFAQGVQTQTIRRPARIGECGGYRYFGPVEIGTRQVGGYGVKRIRCTISQQRDRPGGRHIEVSELGDEGAHLGGIDEREGGGATAQDYRLRFDAAVVVAGGGEAFAVERRQVRGGHDAPARIVGGAPEYLEVIAAPGFFLQQLNVIALPGLQRDGRAGLGGKLIGFADEGPVFEVGDGRTGVAR